MPEVGLVVFARVALEVAGAEILAHQETPTRRGAHSPRPDGKLHLSSGIAVHGVQDWVIRLAKAA